MSFNVLFSSFPIVLLVLNVVDFGLLCLGKESLRDKRDDSQKLKPDQKDLFGEAAPSHSVSGVLLFCSLCLRFFSNVGGEPGPHLVAPLSEAALGTFPQGQLDIGLVEDSRDYRGQRCAATWKW